MEFGFLIVFSCLLVFVLFVWYALQGRGMYLIHKVKSTFSNAEEITLFPEVASESIYTKCFGGAFVLKVFFGESVIYLHRRLLIEAIKYNWHIVIVQSSNIHEGFYGNGWQAHEMKRKNACNVYDKNKYIGNSSLLEQADFIEVTNGKAYYFKELGSIVGSKGIEIFKRAMSG